jgi:hypothetical protein
MRATPIRTWELCFWAVVLIVVQEKPVAAISVGQLSTFTVDLEGWSQGRAFDGAGVMRATGGGPAGAGDPHMQIIADAGGTHGGIVVFNLTPGWSGDYRSVGVTAISMDVKNFGPDNLMLRVALGSSAAPMNGGTWFSSITPAILLAGGDWTNIEFPLAEPEMALIQGELSFVDLLSNVVSLRILHSLIPDDQGLKNVEATLGVDNILAIGIPSTPGDFDGNHIVDGADLTVWKAGFALDDRADADNDSDSDGADFLAWQRSLGQSATAVTATVPEHGGLPTMLIGAVFIAVFFSRWRGR